VKKGGRGMQRPWGGGSSRCTAPPRPPRAPHLTCLGGRADSFLCTFNGHSSLLENGVAIGQTASQGGAKYISIHQMTCVRFGWFGWFGWVVSGRLGGPFIPCSAPHARLVSCNGANGPHRAAAERQLAGWQEGAERNPRAPPRPAPPRPASPRPAPPRQGLTSEVSQGTCPAPSAPQRGSPRRRQTAPACQGPSRSASRRPPWSGAPGRNRGCAEAGGRGRGGGAENGGERGWRFRAEPLGCGQGLRGERSGPGATAFPPVSSRACARQRQTACPPQRSQRAATRRAGGVSPQNAVLPPTHHAPTCVV
jgi:hypothetical protein